MIAAIAEHPRAATPSKTILWDLKPARLFSVDRYTGISQLGTYEICVQSLDRPTIDISVRSFRSHEALTIDAPENTVAAIEQAIHRARALCQAHLSWHLNHDSSWEEIPDALVF